jgi:hypothetical protein
VKVKSKIQKSSKALEEIKLNESEKRYAGSYSAFIYRRPTLYPLEIAVDFLKSL